MPHHTPLIAMIVAGLTLAFILGALAHRLRISPLVGYLIAGVMVGPHTPGFVADQALANELAEIGVILLMFGVGLHFSFKELLSVRAIAVPGAIAQITVATLLGLALTTYHGWTLAAGLVFGLSLSCASTVVLLRAMQERRLLTTERGRIAVGWLIVEDIAMVLALVLLPALAPLLLKNNDVIDYFAPSTTDLLMTLAITIGKVMTFVALTLVLGRRFIPWLLHHVAHTGSRELFRLAVFAIALGFAFGAANLFGVSFALGAFFAGMILSESELSQRAAEETLPLRDAFAVLFFVSVGMLFDPLIVVREFWPVVMTVLIIVLGKSVAALLIVLAFRHPLGTALTISASLAQIGEFSFILASLGVTLGMLPEVGRDLILAGALLSIMMNPLVFMALDRMQPWLDKRDGKGQPAVPEPTTEPDKSIAARLSDHVVLVGHGRVGRRVADGLVGLVSPLLVIDEREEIAAELTTRGIPVITGNATTSLKAANLGAARAVIVAIPDVFEAGQIVAQARATSADLLIVARAHTDAEATYLEGHGADAVVQGARKIADALIARFMDARPTEA